MLWCGGVHGGGCEGVELGLWWGGGGWGGVADHCKMSTFVCTCFKDVWNSHEKCMELA